MIECSNQCGPEAGARHHYNTTKLRDVRMNPNLKSLSYYYNSIKILSSHILRLNITVHKEMFAKHCQLLDCYSVTKMPVCDAKYWTFRENIGYKTTFFSAIFIKLSTSVSVYTLVSSLHSPEVTVTFNPLVFLEFFNIYWFSSHWYTPLETFGF